MSWIPRGVGYSKPHLDLVWKKWQYRSIFTATQNKDERLFSLVARNTGPQSRKIKVETIEKKVVVGSAVQKHGCRFGYTKEHSVAQRDNSSDEDDSFWFSAHYTESCNLELLAHAEQADRHCLRITNWLQYFGFGVVRSLNLYLFKTHSYALFLVIQIYSWKR